VHLQHLAHERSGARFIHPGLGSVRRQLDTIVELLEQSNTSNPQSALHAARATIARLYPLFLRGIPQVAPSRLNTSVRSLAKAIADQFDSPDDGLRACDGLPAADHTWVGVLRKAPGCDKDQVGDGWSRGWLTDNRNYDKLNISARAIAAGLIKESASGNRLHIGWGCWFYAMWNALGWRGAYVNVGRSLRVTTRCTVNRILYGMKGSSDAMCTRNPGDKLWCTFARARGYDSIQIVRGSLYYGSSGRRRPWSELVVCSGECMSRNFADDACVPVARAMSPSSGMEPCACPAGSKEARLQRCAADKLVRRHVTKRTVGRSGQQRLSQDRLRATRHAGSETADAMRSRRAPRGSHARARAQAGRAPGWAFGAEDAA
jgi:hypothetical protein